MAKKKFSSSKDLFKSEQVSPADSLVPVHPVLQNLTQVLPPDPGRGPELGESFTTVKGKSIEPEFVQASGQSFLEVIDNAVIHGGVIIRTNDTAIFELPKFPTAYPIPAPKAEPQILTRYEQEVNFITLAELEELSQTQDLWVSLNRDFLAVLVKRADISTVFNLERGHADYGMSGAEKIYKCQAALPLASIRQGTKVQSEYAGEGTLAHEVGAESVRARLSNEHFKKESFQDRKYTRDMFLYGEQYADYIQDSCHELLNCPHTWFLEERVVLDGERDIWGTGDFGLIAKRNNRFFAVAVDYKYGMGVEVDTENEETGEKNWQLALYLLGFMFKACKVTEQGILIPQVGVAHIFQPRVDTVVQPVVFTISELIEKYLLPYLEKVDLTESFMFDLEYARTKGAQWDSTTVEPYQKVGKWCRFCDAKPICKAYMSSRNVPKAAELFKKTFDAGLIKHGAKEVAKTAYQTGVMSAEDLSFLALNGSKIRSLIESAEEAVVDLLQSGEVIPDCALDKTTGRRSWVEDIELVEKTLLELGIEEPTTTVKKVAIGIGDVEKQVGKGALDNITQAGEGSIKVVHIDKLKNPAAIGPTGAAVLYKKFVEGQK